MPKITPKRRAPLLDKLEKGGGFSAPIRVSASGSGYTQAKAYNDANRAVGKAFDFFMDMIEEVFDVKLTRTRGKKRGKPKLW